MFSSLVQQQTIWLPHSTASCPILVVPKARIAVTRLNHWFDSARVRTRWFESRDLPKRETDIQLGSVGNVMGVMKMGNIVPGAGIKPTSLTFRARVLPSTITPHRLPDVTTMPTPTCLCDSLPQRSVQTTTLI